jgi:hypothetical protein
MKTKSRKATFNLHVDILEALDEVMSHGAAPSKNALVEQALLKELKDLKRQARRTLWQKAAKDPLFVRDIKEIEDDFRYADAETDGSIDK